MLTATRDNTTAVVLAGGRGRRLGGADKGLVEFAGRPLIDTILRSIRPQVGEILINANRNQTRYRAFGHRVIGDRLGDYQGPLAGFAAALATAGPGFVLTLPCDAPRVPADLQQRLATALDKQQADLAVAHDGHRLQPVYALIPTRLEADLVAFLDAGERKIDLWYARHRMAVADFSDTPEVFANINTPDDQQRISGVTPG